VDTACDTVDYWRSLRLRTERQTMFGYWLHLRHFCWYVLVFSLSCHGPYRSPIGHVSSVRPPVPLIPSGFRAYLRMVTEASIHSHISLWYDHGHGAIHADRTGGSLMGHQWHLASRSWRPHGLRRGSCRVVHSGRLGKRDDRRSYVHERRAHASVSCCSLEEMSMTDLHA
jgi:hypothetical protein